MRILAIDDNPDNLITLSAVVKNALPGVDVVVTQNGSQGIDLARSLDPDMILLDIVMPVMDGFEVCRKLKKDDLLCEIPVVFLTASKSGRENRIKALEAGAEGFLSKPLDEPELIAQIRAMAKIKQINRSRRLETNTLGALVAERTAKLERELTERKRAESALRDSEIRYRQLVQTQTEAICRWLPDTTITFVNEAYCRVFNKKSEQLLGSRWIDLVPPESRNAVLSVYRGISPEQSKIEYEHEVISDDGTKRWMEWIDVPLRGDDGSICEFQSMGRDITLRRNAEQKERESHESLQALYEAAHVLNSTLDIEILYEKAYDTIQKLMDCDVFYISDFNSETQLISCNAAWHDGKRMNTSHLPPIPLEPEGKGTQSLVIRSGKSMLMDDYLAYMKTAQTSMFVDADGNPVDRVPDDADITRSAIIVPLFLEGKVQGVIQVFSYQLKAYTTRQLSLVESLATLIALSLNNAKLHAQARAEIAERKQAEEQTAVRARQQAVVTELGQLALSGVPLSALIDQIVNCIVNVLDVDYCKVLECLPDHDGLSLRAGYGWREGCIGVTVIENGLESHAGFTLLSKEPVVLEDARKETRFSCSSLLIDHHVVSGISTIIGDPNRPYGILSVHSKSKRSFTVHDVHFLQGTAHLLASAIQREIHEAEIDRMNRLYATLSQINQTIVRCSSPEDLFFQFCRVTVEYGQFKMAWVGVKDSKTGQFEMIQHYQESIGDRDADELRTHVHTIFNESLHAGQCCLINDVLLDERANDYRHSMAQSGIRSCALFPFLFQGEIYGAIGLCASEPGFFNPDETGLLEEVAQDLSYALEHLDQDARRREAEAALKDSQNYLQNVLDFSNDGIFVDDAETGDILDVNRATCELYGYSREEILKLPIGELSAGTVPYDHIHAMEWLRKARDVGPQTFTWLAKRRDATLFWAEVSIRFAIFGSANRFVVIVRDISERMKAEADHERLIAAIEQTGEAVVITDPDGVIQYVNPAFERVTGYTRDEAKGNTPNVLKSGKQGSDFYFDLWNTISSGRTWHNRIVNKRKDGSLYTEDATISPVRDSSGKIVNYVAVKRDISGHLELEAQYQQAQKMESVGRLAGGVAHDFNNMLGLILGHSEMGLEKLYQGHPLYDDLQEIRKAAVHSADLTGKLLAFARKQTIAPKILDLNETVEGMLKMLRRLMGEDIELTWLPGNGVWSILMDPSQIDQILANLCVNARDAIKGLGRVKINTENVSFDEGYCSEHIGFLIGDFVMLAVGDDGCGMTDEILANLFEPFFTTKESGKGTGLGLATVYGIVKQNHGFIHVESEPGEGSTFQIYLPKHGAPVERVTTKIRTKTEVRGTETVLLVEDELAILSITSMMLKRLGYTVVMSSSPKQAIQMADQYSGTIHLLMTDVIMPEMNGRDLSEILKSRFDNLKILYMSGYTADIIAHHGVLDEGVHFIQKPFSVNDLANKLREALSR